MRDGPPSVYSQSSAAPGILRHGEQKGRSPSHLWKWSAVRDQRQPPSLLTTFRRLKKVIYIKNEYCDKCTNLQLTQALPFGRGPKRVLWERESKVCMVALREGLQNIVTKTGYIHSPMPGWSPQGFFSQKHYVWKVESRRDRQLRRHGGGCVLTKRG